METVRSLILSLVQEHERIEIGLDRLADAIPHGNIDPGMIRNLAESNALHYSHEERFLQLLGARDPRLAAKLRAQHEEASEIAARTDEALAAGNITDAVYLARRFLAIAQHNIIEEERDVFPWAERFLDDDTET